MGFLTVLTLSGAGLGCGEDVVEGAEREDGELLVVGVCECSVVIGLDVDGVSLSRADMLLLHIYRGVNPGCRCPGCLWKIHRWCQIFSVMRGK